MKINRKWVVLAMMLGSFLLNGCSTERATVQEPHKLLEGDFVQESTCEIEIPGLTKEYHFYYLADMHIVVCNEEVAESDRDLVYNRYNEFAMGELHSAEGFDRLVKYMNKNTADGLWMGGDMIDFLSEGNTEALTASLSILDMPYLYVTADHDVSGWWTDYSEETQKEMKGKLPYECIQVCDYDEFIVVGVSENTGQLRAEALEELKEVFALGKPVILIQHVPFASTVNDELYEMSKDVWDDRALLWGEDCAYVANETTQEYIDMVHAADSPVVAVFAGHLHFVHEGMINDHTKQFVCNPGFKGDIMYVTIKGNK